METSENPVCTAREGLCFVFKLLQTWRRGKATLWPLDYQTPDPHDEYSQVRQGESVETIEVGRANADARSIVCRDNIYSQYSRVRHDNYLFYL